VTRLGTCSNCGGDVMLVVFDTVNGCRFCMGCGRRGPDVVLVIEAMLTFEIDEEEPTFVELGPDEPTRVGGPDVRLIEIARRHDF